MTGAAVAFGALAIVGATQGSAQSVEAIMQARERLELTEEQLGQLDAIRREIVEQRVAEMAEMAELRSQLQAGEIQRSDLMAAREDRRAGAREVAEQRRERIDAVLTETQLESAQQLRPRQGRLRAGMRRGVRPGRAAFGPRNQRGVRGFRGIRGLRPGPGGFGPR